MSFGVSCHLAFHVILVIIVIIVTKVLNGINAQSCYRGPVCLQKVGALRCWEFIGRCVMCHVSCVMEDSQPEEQRKIEDNLVDNDEGAASSNHLLE